MQLNSRFKEGSQWAAGIFVGFSHVIRMHLAEGQACTGHGFATSQEIQPIEDKFGRMQSLPNVVVWDRAGETVSGNNFLFGRNYATLLIHN